MPSRPCLRMPTPTPPPSLAASAPRAQVSAPAAVMMIDSPGSPRPLAARAPDRMPTPAPFATHEGVVGRRCGAGGLAGFDNFIIG